MNASAKRGVPVVGRGDQHGVKVRRVVQQLAIVRVAFGLLARFVARPPRIAASPFDLSRVGIAEGNERRAGR